MAGAVEPANGSFGMKLMDIRLSFEMLFRVSGRSIIPLREDLPIERPVKFELVILLRLPLDGCP
jgi:hypothetical protein